ncbi:MAG: iron ABC transporter permease [Planctomycetota bacterium]|nr:iron ABC transporter permease [Planctomycetota bacterium]
MARQLTLLIGLALLLVAGVAVSLVLGVAEASDDVVRLRAIRAVLAALAGAGLAVAGVLTQGLFRNPLAGPSILGTTAGAAFGGQFSLLTHGLLVSVVPWMVPELLLPIGCALGAGLALVLLMGLTARSRSALTVLLVGFVLSSLFASLGALVTSLSQSSWELGRAVVVFSLGSLDGKGLVHVALALPLIVIGIAASWTWARDLDLLLAGRDEARSLGVSVERTQTWILVWVAMLTAAAVAVGGGVAFVGLVVPHALRPFAGVAHRRLLPASILGGAAYVVWCDVVARAFPAIGEVPLGVVTGLVGIPVFVMIFRRSEREAGA